MKITRLKIKNFRSHEFLDLSFSPQINALVGPNGAGKTNILEAIYYLSLGRSFRTLDSRELIEKGKDRAVIEAVVEEGKRTNNIKIVISEKGRSVLVNGKPIHKLVELSSLTNVLLFIPSDVDLFRGSPHERRRFLDISISKMYPAYMDLLSQYNHLVKERNIILKSESVDVDLLKSTTELIVKVAKPIDEYRVKYVESLNTVLNPLVNALTGEDSKLEIIYYPFIKTGENYLNDALNAYNASLDRDLKLKSTSIGIHHEDFSLLYQGEDIASYGSQGENRICALALKLAPYFLIKDEDKKPIILLDDVMSELDDNNKARLIDLLPRFNQAFISGTTHEVSNAREFEIKKA
ncbi:MAG: DNA replication/repair protein RecF [Coprobacillus sp.]|nr:DNA replication/repair protein RecF [Coprobacillus sp.]